MIRLLPLHAPSVREKRAKYAEDANEAARCLIEHAEQLQMQVPRRRCSHRLPRATLCAD
jgi:hypothetical protein